jgi:branched-chain amino acid transport system permease protein
MLSAATGRFKTSYAADAAIQRVPLARVAFWGGLLLVFLVPPRVLDNYWLNNVNAVWMAVIAAVGLNILVGYTGQISLGHGAFAMVGAFTVGLLYNRFPGLKGSPIELLVTIPVAGAAAALVGTMFGVPSLRVKGLYLAIATFAAHPILEWVVLHLVPKMTKEGRITAALQVPRPAINLGFWQHTIRTDVDRFYLFGIIAIIGILFAENLFRTRVGRAWVAIRDREVAAESIGISVFKYKLMAFALSAFYAGVAGALLAYWYRSVNHEAFGVTLSVQYLAMTIIGGMGSIPGAVLGAAFIIGLPIIVRDDVITPLSDLGGPFERLKTYYTFVEQMIFGLLIIVFIIWEPNGLYRLWSRLKNAVRQWPFAY